MSEKHQLLILKYETKGKLYFINVVAFSSFVFVLDFVLYMWTRPVYMNERLS